MSLQSRCSHKVIQVAQAGTTRMTSQLTTTKSIWHVESVTADKPYQVNLEWAKEGDQLVIKTQLISHSHKDNSPHPANLGYTVSYHILGVIKKMAQDKGKKIHFASSEANAKKQAGEIIRIDNMGNGSVWASYQDTFQQLLDKVKLNPAYLEDGMNHFDIIDKLESRYIQTTNKKWYLVENGQYQTNYGSVKLINHEIGTLEIMLKNSQSQLKYNVELMRGPVEEGIE